MVSIALCAAASNKAAHNGKEDKKVKRGLLELGTANFGNIYSAAGPYAAPYAAHSVPSYQSLAAPFIPSPQLVPETNTFLHSAAHAAVGPAHAVHYAAPVVQHHAVEEVAPQVRTIVKHVPVPYERIIKVDNPIYTQFERQIPGDFCFLNNNYYVIIMKPLTFKL